MVAQNQYAGVVNTMFNTNNINLQSNDSPYYTLILPYNAYPMYNDYINVNIIDRPELVSYNSECVIT